MSITWTCGCSHRNFLHQLWCGSCGNSKPATPPDDKKSGPKKPTFKVSPQD